MGYLGKLSGDKGSSHSIRLSVSREIHLLEPDYFLWPSIRSLASMASLSVNGTNGVNGTDGRDHGGLQVLVVGAGIAGLAVAIGLRKQGHHVQVRSLLLLCAYLVTMTNRYSSKAPSPEKQVQRFISHRTRTEFCRSSVFTRKILKPTRWNE